MQQNKVKILRKKKVKILREKMAQLKYTHFHSQTTNIWVQKCCMNLISDLREKGMWVILLTQHTTQLPWKICNLAVCLDENKTLQVICRLYFDFIINLINLIKKLYCISFSKSLPYWNPCIYLETCFGLAILELFDFIVPDVPNNFAVMTLPKVGRKIWLPE